MSDPRLETRQRGGADAGARGVRLRSVLADHGSDRLAPLDHCHLTPVSPVRGGHPNAVVDEGLVDHVRLSEQLLITLMGKHLERVQHLDAGVPTERQPETPPECLLGEDVGDRRP